MWEANDDNNEVYSDHDDNITDIDDGNDYNNNNDSQQLWAWIQYCSDLQHLQWQLQR